MSTPTVTTLESVSDKFAEGMLAVITADGTSFPLPAYGVRDTVKMPINRVEVRASQFYRASDQMNFNPNGAPFYNHRRGFLSLTVVTQRAAQVTKGSASPHGVAIGRCRWLLSRLAQKLIPGTVNGYEVMDVIDLGDQYVRDEVTDTDRTELRFQIDLVIPSANYTDT